MYCKNCGKEINNDVSFCPFCGTKQDEKEELAALPTSKEKNCFSKEKVIQILEKTIKFLPKIGFYSCLSGIGIILLIVLIGLVFYGKVYLYDGYGFTKVFCTINVILMLFGAIVCGGLLVYKFIKKEITFDKRIILRIAVVSLSVVFSIVSLCNAAAINKKNHSCSSSSSSSMNAYTYAVLYLDITNVNVTSNSSYTICTGKITNTGNMSVRYIKVKGAFKNASGITVDTDWTYGIGSEWLAPGESTTFRLSVSRDTSIKKCNVTFIT